MVLEVIYVVRHGYSHPKCHFRSAISLTTCRFRSNWVVDHETGEYRDSIPGPTGIPSDPALASYGVLQARELGTRLVTLDPPIDVIYSSAFYRCLQTIKPGAEALFAQGKAGGKIRVETGIGEFYGKARFDHPSPATLQELEEEHFPGLLDKEYKSVCVPSKNGETIAELHDRVAYTLLRIIETLDSDPNGPKTVVLCSHAAVIIAIGRVLTGRMPENISEEDFKCYTAGLSMFDRRMRHLAADELKVEDWQPGKVPDTHWRGRGLVGGWDCVLNSDCTFLLGGEERGWRFSGDEGFLTDPNKFNDKANEAKL